MKTLRAFGFHHPLKGELERLLAIQADLRTSIRCLQLLVPPSRLMRESGTIGMSLHTQALVSYVRCFTSGRRKGLPAEEVYFGKPDLLAAHNDIKALRDKHVAHSVSEHEHCSILVAAKDEASPAQGLGVRYWFFAGGDDKHMKRFLKLSEFAHTSVEAKVVAVGNELAKTLLGPRTTWKRAQARFYAAVPEEEVYGPTRHEA